MPEIFYWVKIWRFSWCTPPIDSFLCIESLGCTRSVFRIIILHKSVRIWGWKRLLNKWEQCAIQNFTEQWCCHYAFKNAHWSGTFLAYSTPYVHFNRVLRTRFWLGSFPFLSIPKAAVILKLYSGFITPNYILKRVMEISLCPLKPFHFVFIANKLTIS